MGWRFAFLCIYTMLMSYLDIDGWNGLRGHGTDGGWREEREMGDQTLLLDCVNQEDLTNHHTRPSCH